MRYLNRTYRVLPTVSRAKVAVSGRKCYIRNANKQVCLRLRGGNRNLENAGKFHGPGS